MTWILCWLGKRQMNFENERVEGETSMKFVEVLKKILRRLWLLPDDSDFMTAWMQFQEEASES